MSSHHLRLTALVLAAMVAATVSAQTTPTAQEVKSTDKNAADQPVVLEKVEVTGSHIRTLVGEQTALPVISISQIELEQRGVSRLADLRWAVPQLAASNGFNDNLQNGGPSRAQQTATSFNLRGLGGNSTLVLIDGHRVPHTGQSAPGGAGGREDFNIDGIPLSAVERVEVLPQGAGAIYGTEAIAGVINIILKKNYTGSEITLNYDNTFDTDVAQTTVSLTGGYRAGRLSTFFTLSQTEQNGLASRDRFFTYPSPASSLLYVPYSGAGSLSTGYWPSSSTGVLPGLTKPVVAIPGGSKGAFTAAEAAAATLGAPYDYAAYAMQIDPSRSRSLVWKADYNYASWLQPYVQVRWSDFNNKYTGTPNTLTTSLPVGYVGNPFSSAVYLSKVFYDLPSPHTESHQLNSGVTIGARGDLPRDWDYDTSFAWARNIAKDSVTASGFDSTKLAAAMKAATPIILTYDSSVAGTDPNASGLIRSLLTDSSHKDVTDVYQYTAQVGGPVWTGWAGDVQLAVGGEVQHEKVRFSRTPPISYLLNAPFSRRSTAGFAEVSLPLLSEAQQLPLVHRLTVGGAVRYEDLSDLGGHSAPNMHALFQPVKWVSFRASRAEGFKSPKLYDLLAPNYSTTTTINASRGIKDTLRGNAPVSGTYALTTGGQPHLKPETSVSRDAGVVIDIPGAWFKGLSFSADFWDLKYTNQVGGPSYQVLIDYFPDRVKRDPASNVITGFDTSNLNLAKVATRGVDYRLTYQRMFDFGDITFNAAFSDPGVQWTTSTPGAKPDSTYGHQPNRYTSSLFWSRGPWTAGVSTNYQQTNWIYGPASPQNAKHPYIEWNPQVSYDFGRDSSRTLGTWTDRILSGMKISVTIMNVFDKKPDPNDYNYTMDPRLRRYILNVAKRF